MASRFWTYFQDKLQWALIHAPGPIAAVIKGLAHRLDVVRDDVVFLRDQGFAQKCEPELVPVHGAARGITRHVTETPEQFRQRVINAYAWHMLAGKQEGLPQILRFYGFDTAEIEGIAKYQSSRWAEFQVGLPALAGQGDFLESLELLVWLINEYKPARSLLARLYTDAYNITPLNWSEGRYSEHFYSHFSGVPASELGQSWKDEGLILSFGQRVGVAATRAEYGKPILSGLQQTGFVAPYIDSPVWSEFAYSDAFPGKHGFTIGELVSVDWCVQTTTSHPWAGNWDARHWTEFSAWDRILPRWSMRSQSISRSQLVYGDEHTGPDAGTWGGCNACYSVPTTVLINNPPVWGAFAYSDDPERREVVIHEQYIHQRGTTTAPFNPQDGTFVTQGVFGIQSAPLHNRCWSGAWDSRRWCNDTAFVSITSQTKEFS